MPSGSAQRRTLINAVTSPLLRDALAALAKETPEVQLVGSARDALESFNLMQSLRPDVVILDAALAGPLKGLMRADAHLPRVLLLSYRSHLGTQAPCGADCACGFVRDRAPTAHIRAMLRLIARCEIPSPRQGLGRCGKCPATYSLALPRLPLSERQYDIFVRIGRGQSTGETAAALGVSVKTVETHREIIKRKLGLSSAHALVNAAIKWRDGELSANDVPDTPAN